MILGPDINHSFSPNCEIVKSNVEVFFIDDILWGVVIVKSKKNIETGNMLTLKYNRKGKKNIIDSEFMSNKEKEWKEKFEKKGIFPERIVTLKEKKSTIHC